MRAESLRDGSDNTEVQGLHGADGRHLDEITDRLRRLIAQGFRFAHPRDSDGGLVAVIGVRAHHDVIDIVQLFGESDADAARIPGDEPDILYPRKVLWRNTGYALDVLDSALALPDPGVPAGARQATNGCWIPTQPGRATWLTAFA